MNDSTSDIALIQSRLPYTDRRALSEAWFSALHLASDGPVARNVPERSSAREKPATPSGSAHESGPRSVAGFVRPTALRDARTVRPALTGEAPRPRVASPRRRAVASPPVRSQACAPPFCTSLTIGLASGRVQLLLRREGGTLTVVALCRPQLAETVRRALALAGAHLRMRGEPVRSSVRTCEAGEVRA